MLIRSFGWLGAVALVIAPPFIDTDAGKIISIIGLALLTIQAIDKSCYNLVLLNILGIGGYAYALYI